MKPLSPVTLAWLLPITILAHQLEEYLMGFPKWYSDLLNAQLSNSDFLLINGIGLFLFTIYAWSYHFNRSNFILLSLGTLVLVNGIIHLGLSVFTWSFSPGTITGVFLFLPLGVVIFKKILPLLSQGQQVIAIATGILVLFLVSLIAMNI